MSAQPHELALGAAPPAFSLPDVVHGRVVSLDEVSAGRPLLVMFLCRHCPYVKHVEGAVTQLALDYAGNLGVVGISSNDATSHPEDAPGSLRDQAERAGFTFPYLYDESQAVARAYGAVCTPEFFLFDASPALAYHGRLDATRPGRGASTGVDLRLAIDSVLASKPVTGPQPPSVGCSIKWKGR